MKEDTNNEMDLLLRRLSRRQDESMPDADPNIAGEHFDADELNSYAENVLPAAARARYTEHLADCSSCRELIV
ncbi:MAG TPA: zf-HC2 domain-containing protein, partial [Pyrinomonadaceae bacterium]|nr:zf-HC2 domain-containing protein [Pyrinomonadaceae bacterium]